LAEGQVGEREDRLRRIRYLDFTLGAWRPREAAFQLAANLEVELRSLAPEDPERAVMAVGARSVDIDAEGDPTVVTAHDDAARIAKKLPGGAVVVVLSPRFGLPLRVENEWFFLFLRRLGISVTIIGDEPAITTIASNPFERRRGIVPPEWIGRPELIAAEGLRLLRFFPGLLPRALAEKREVTSDAVGLAPAGRDFFLIPTGYRDKDPRDSARDFDAMAEIEAADDGFLAISQTFCTSYFADADRLAGLGREVFRRGGVDLARDLLARARAVARNPTDAARVDLHRQEVRIFERDFAAAAAAPDPSRRAPAELLPRLHLLRGFGAATAGNLAVAEPDAAILLVRLRQAEPLSADDLTFLDALARARLRRGDIDGAAALAQAIEAALGRVSDADPRIVFLNALTAAAIARKRGDAPAHRVALERAFAGSLGVRSLAEILEMNVWEARAESDPVFPAARLAWLRAAFAWLAFEPSEGLGFHAALAVLGGEEVSRPNLENAVSEALVAALQKAWPEVDAARRSRLPAIRPGGAASIHPEKIFGAPGIAVLWSPEAAVTPVRPPTRARLVRLALDALAELCPKSSEIEAGTILVDANLGIDLPRSRPDVNAVALRTGVKEIVYGTDARVLTDGERRRLAADLHVGLSPVVAKIETVEGRTIVGFRRRLPDKVLSADEAAIVEPFRDGSRLSLAALVMTLGKPVEAIEPDLRRLESERVLGMEVTARAPSLHEDGHAVGTAG
jgi:hypothetical protein